MGFSKTAEYALRAMVHLARRTDAVTAEALSVSTRVPGPYLAKILRQLTRAGLVHAVRGKNGGCRLSPAGREATVYAVVQAVDPVCRIRSCPLGVPEHDGKLCPLHAAMDASFAVLEASFKTARVVELIDCDMPPNGWLSPGPVAGDAVRAHRSAAAGKTAPVAALSASGAAEGGLAGC